MMNSQWYNKSSKVQTTLERSKSRELASDPLKPTKSNFAYI